MTRGVWDRPLEEARTVHNATPALASFCAFPDDISAQDVDPFHIPSSDLLQAETGFITFPYASLAKSIQAAAPSAHWRLTYKDTHIGQDFLGRFGCYCILGTKGAFHSPSMAAWIVYMPAALHYPWHHHPGEEIYMVLPGSAQFFRKGEAPEILTAGQTSQHASNQPHAMETGDSPVLCYVVWRNGFETGPVLTEGAA